LLLAPFKLSRIGILGFSALASALPNYASADDEVARGKYIVENVAKCTECHSPRGQNEELGKGLSLSGARLDFKPITPNASWAESAPNIRGIKGYNEEAAVTLFFQGHC
jgi:mono/diheme cytochrome c family protein